MTTPSSLRLAADRIAVVLNPRATVCWWIVLFQGTRAALQPGAVPCAPSSFKHVVLTHAHLDHSGYLPKLIKEGFRGTIFATPATVDLCGVLLPDSGHIQESDARFANKKGFSKHKPALPLYTEVEAVETLQFLKPVPYGRTERISPLLFSFQPAGHFCSASYA
jgi:metallo-beta-lactamase family protein